MKLEFFKIFFLLVALQTLSVFAIDGSKVTFSATTNKPALEYEPGEPIIFLFNIDLGGQELDEKLTIRWNRDGDDGIHEEGSIEYDGKTPAELTTKLECNGFVDIYANIRKEDGTLLQNPNFECWGVVFPREHFFHGGAAVHPELLTATPEPEDFDEFWTRQKARLDKVPVLSELKEIGKNEIHSVYTVRVLCAGPRPVTGVLSIPAGAAKGEKYPARIDFDGYGYHWQQAMHPGVNAKPDEIVFHLNAHGVEYEQSEGYYTAFGASIKENGKEYAFDETVNSDPETAYFNGMVLRIMRALQFLKTLPAWNGKDLKAFGGSQGGLQAIWAAALEPDLTYADAFIIWGCDLGGNANFKRHFGPWYIPYTRALDYYDPVNMAKRIKCEVMISRAGLGDYTCPPSGIAILYNNMTCRKTIKWYQNSEHGSYPKADIFTYSDIK